MKIAVFHYHLLPGGVTSVIALSLEALAKHARDIEEIVLVTGLETNAPELTAKLQLLFKKSPCTIRYAVIPDIGYVDKHEADELDPEKLKAALTGQFRGYIWWIHNHHIGKNPVFTRSVIEIAGERKEQPVLFHIHDFPEAARYANLRFLRSFYTGTLYPSGKNIWYSLINSRDYRLLKDAGLPEERLVLLQNPVPGDPPPPLLSNKEKSSIRKDLARHPNFRPDLPSLLYPVRCIRRKNVLEAGLIAAVSPFPCNLLLTLPGTSEQEKGYSRLTSRYFTEGTLTGAFPTAHTVDYQKIISFSDAIISTSVQEGFGYLYINTLQWGKPLIARNIEILDDFTPFFSSETSTIYDTLVIPCDLIDTKLVTEKYNLFLHSFSGLIPEAQRELLLQQAEKLCGSGSIDFSYLPPEMQGDVLKRIQTGNGIDEIRRCNRELFHNIGPLLTKGGYTPPASLEKSFGMKGYADSCASIFARMMSDPLPRGSGSPPDDYIFKYFITLPNFRLLYAPLPP